MKILITGNMGYIGPSVVDQLYSSYKDAELVGLDSGFFAHCLTGALTLPEVRLHKQIFCDVRHVTADVLEDVYAVIHLAGISNDPIGNTFSQVTDEINCLSSIRLAKLSKESGVKRFVFASSCSVYGAAEGGPRKEEDELNPLTAYAKSKIGAEKGIASMAEDDFVVVNYKGTIDDKPITDTVKVARGLSEQSNAWLHLKRNPLVPGLVEALIGGNKGDKKTVPVKFPEEFIYEELVGKEGQFEVEIVDIKEQSLPELDDTFAKSFGAEGIDKLTEGVEADLKNELEYSEKQSIRNQCVQKLLEKVTCDLPETIVNQATRAVVHNIVQSNHNRGVSKDVIEENKDDIYSNAKSNAEVRVKANYILAQIAEKEGIKVTEQELSRQISAMAMQQKIKPQKMADQLKENGGIYEVQEEILNSKVIDLLEEKAKITEVDPKPESDKDCCDNPGEDCCDNPK